jgi:multidrug efflux pump
MIVAYRNGAPVRLTDVADVIDSAENTRLAAWANDSAAVIVNIQRQPGANVIEVVDRIKRLLPQLQASLPASIDVVMLTDRTVTIRASVRDVQFELMLAVALVVMIIFRVPAQRVGDNHPQCRRAAVPDRHVCGDVSRRLLDQQPDADGAYHRHRLRRRRRDRHDREHLALHRAGRAAAEAALKGAEQIGFTIISLTVSLIAVLIPLLFMGDVVGRLFREFAITLAVAILLSAVVSLTLTPMMCARLLRHVPEREQGRFFRKSGEWFERVIAGYARMLTWVLDRQGATLLVALGTLVLTVVMYIVIPKGFFPVQDTGAIQGISESIADDLVRRNGGAPAGAREDHPRGSGGREPVLVHRGRRQQPHLNSGRFLINLKPLSQRSGRATDVIRRLQDSLAGVEGIVLYMQPVQDLTIEDKVSRTQYQFSVEDADSAELRTWVPKLVERLRQDTRLSDVATDQQEGGLQAYVEIDRATASRFGITPAAIDSALYNAFGQRLVSTIFTQTNQYRVVLEVGPEFRKGPVRARWHLRHRAERCRCGRSGSGATRGYRRAGVRVEHPADTAVDGCARRRAHRAPGREPHRPVSCRDDLVQPRARRVARRCGEGDRAGAARNQHAGFRAGEAAGSGRRVPLVARNQVWLILAAIVTVYIVLGVLYESYIHPITILSTLPSAGVGALLALFSRGNDLDVIAIIGIILLIGIVKKNAIMMIDFAIDAERDRQMARATRSSRRALCAFARS